MVGDIPHPPPWEQDVRRIFASKDAIPIIDESTCPALARLIEEDFRFKGMSVRSFVERALTLRLAKLEQSADREDLGRAAGAVAALVLDNAVPTQADLALLTGSNGERPRWPSLTARQAWAYASGVRAKDLSARAGSAGSGRRHWEKYREACTRAISDVLGDLSPDSSSLRYDDTWYRCRINQTVQEVDAMKRSYILRTQFHFLWHGDALVLAQSTDETSADWICAEYPEILDVFTTVPDGLFRFGAFVRPERGRETWRELKFQGDVSLRDRMLEQFPEFQSQNLLVWRSEPLPQARPNWVKLTCDFELPLTDPYFYWSAPHRVQLETLSADISRLRPHTHGRLWSAPKLARRPLMQVDHQLDTLTVDVGDFVAPGQSIDVRWDGQ
jgi:hypothetical protein